jgi:hypothetical protein
MTSQFIKSNKAKSNLTIASLALVLFVIGINFQNCSNTASSNFGDSSSGGAGGLENVPIVNPGDDDDDDPSTPTPTPGSGDEPGSVTATFSAGDRYQGQVLVSANSFLDTMLSTFNYRNYSFSKAIAVAENGLGYMSLSDVNNSSEAERMAVESCNLLANLPCALIVSDNTFVINSTDIANNLEYVIGGQNGNAFNRNQIPMTTNSVRNSTLVSNYINAEVEKAMALSVTGGVYVTYTYSYQLTRQEVERMAVQQCELQAALTPCILYAVNDTVVFDPDDWVKRTQLVFNNNNVMAIPPPASRNGALTAIRSFLDGLTRDDKYAIAITANGYGFFASNSSLATAQSQASNNCINGAHGSRCIGYADSEGVKLTPEKTQAKSNYPSLYCKTVRYSCNDHRSVGCESGVYWVQNARSLGAEITNCQ